MASVTDATYFNFSDGFTRGETLAQLETEFFGSGDRLSLLGYGQHNGSDGFLPGPKQVSIAGEIWTTAQFLVRAKSLARTLPTGLRLPEPYEGAAWAGSGATNRVGVYRRSVNGSFLEDGLAGCDVGCAKSHGQDLEFETPTIDELLSHGSGGQFTGGRSTPAIDQPVDQSSCRNLTVLGTGAGSCTARATAAALDDGPARQLQRRAEQGDPPRPLSRFRCRASGFTRRTTAPWCRWLSTTSMSGRATS